MEKLLYNKTISYVYVQEVFQIELLKERQQL